MAADMPPEFLDLLARSPLFKGAEAVELKAALQAAKVQVVEAGAAIEAAIARRDRIKVDLLDSKLKSPVSGRVLYRLAEPGEVLPVGGKVFTVLQLTDVYMTIFLPTAEAGRVDLARISHRSA